MVKVCHITSVHERYDQRIFKKECISLAEEGYHVTLLVNDSLGEEKIKDVRIKSASKQKGTSRLKRLFSLNAIFKEALEIDAEIYHLHDPELLLIAKKLIKKNKKVIFDSHENYFRQISIKPYLKEPFRKIIARIYCSYETHICTKIDGVIFIRPEIINGKEFNPFEGRCKRQAYVANYPLNNMRKNQEKRTENEFSVCYAGSLSRARGITNLVKACYGANCKLILAGKFSSEEYKEELMKEREFSCVEYKGEVSLEGVYSIYDESNVGMSTLLNEGQYATLGTFPVKVFEYFQNRLPVIMSNYLYAVNMNEKYKFGICVDPGNIEEISKAIAELRKDEELREMYANNGYTLYKKFFNWDVEKSNLFKLYQEILNNH